MRNDVVDGIRNNLPRILFERDMQIMELSAMTGIKYPTLHNIVHGKKKSLTFGQMAALIDALDLPLCKLFERAKERGDSEADIITAINAPK